MIEDYERRCQGLYGVVMVYKLMVVRGIGEEAEQIKCDYMFSGYVTITLSFSVINLEGSNGRIYLHLSQISNF